MTAPKRSVAPAASRSAAPGKKARNPKAGRTREDDMPAAGPHAKPHLMDPERTPGAGALSRPGDPRDSDATG